MASILQAVVWLVGVVFVAAGSLKLRDRRQFRAEVADYQVLPSGLVPVAAALLPPVELIGGALVLIRPTRMVATGVLAVCLLAFTMAVVVNLRRGRTDISCACFGGRSRHIDWFIVGRNGVMCIALVAGLVVSPDAAVPSPGAGVTVLLCLALMWTAWEARALNTPIGGQRQL
jgi:hypothetical protein